MTDQQLHGSFGLGVHGAVELALRLLKPGGPVLAKAKRAQKIDVVDHANLGAFERTMHSVQRSGHFQ